MAIKKHDLVNWTPIDSTNPLKSLAYEVNLNLDAIQAAINSITSGGIASTVVQNSITLGATTTAPGVGTRTVQRIEAQTIGDKVRLTYKLGQVAVSAGSGSYLLSLPTGMSFNTTYNPVWTGAEWTGGVSAVAPYHIPATGGITIDGNWTNQIIVVPYDSTRFRLMLTNNNSQQTFMFWNQGWYAASASTGIDLQLSFEIWK